MAEGEEDIELLIGVYSSEAAARRALERLKNGFVDFPQGFNIYPCELDKDHWLEGFNVDLGTRRILPAWLNPRESE